MKFNRVFFVATKNRNDLKTGNSNKDSQGNIIDEDEVKIFVEKITSQGRVCPGNKTVL